MTNMEILAIVGGLIFGYIFISIVMNLESNSHSEKAESNKESDSSQKNSTNEEDSHQSISKDIHISANWFKILEVTESATLSEITQQYKRKIREYHPDKVASLGRELRELAELKSKEINNAYEYAKSIKV